MTVTQVRELRPYQEQAITAIDKAFREGKRDTVLALAPSGGKTFTAVRYCESFWLSKGKRVLWLAHREELIDQAANDVAEYCEGRTVSKWYHAGKDLSGDIVVASVPSYRSLLNAIKSMGAQFGLIVIDECHHAAGQTYKNIYEEVPHEFRLGLSGTPKRMDEKEFGFTNIGFQAGYRMLAQAGWCASDRYIRFRTKQSHMLSVRGGEFTASSMKPLNNAPRNDLIADFFFKHRTPEGCECKQKCKTTHWPGMFYACDIEHSYSIRDALMETARERGHKSFRCAVVTGETPKEERRDIIEMYKEGRIDAIVNCQVFTEGTDLPQIRSIHLCRPTASETLWLQMALRGARSKPGFQATGNDPSKGKHPDNCYYLVDYVDSVHHYMAASRGWALSHLSDKDQVKLELQLQDESERAREILGLLDPNVVDEFKQKQFRRHKTEESELEPEAWMLSQVGAVLITSSKFHFEKQTILSAEQDFAILCATEYLKRRFGSTRSTPDERKFAIQRAHQLFAAEDKLFTMKDWSDHMYAYLNVLIWRNATERTNGGRSWLHQSAVETPPLEEVYKVIDEIEAEAEKANNVWETNDQMKDAIAAAIAETNHPDMWMEQFNKVLWQSAQWRDGVLFCTVHAGVLDQKTAWFEAVLESLLRKASGVPTALVRMTYADNVYGPCPSCGKPMTMRRSGTGNPFYGCTGYPDCNETAHRKTKAEVFEEMRRMLPKKG